MLASMLFFLLLFLPSTFSADSCPSECDCDESTQSGVWNVFCHRGGLNDTKFSELLSRLPANIRSLDIRGLSDRPANVFKWNDNLNRFTQLRVLRLINCSIPALSRGIRLKSLEVLDLRRNLIDHASMSNFGGLPSLKRLDLSHNQLSILPTGVFTYLSQLRSLSLANNTISELSTNLLRGLRNLKALHLDSNRIPVKQVNDLFSDVTQLEELYLNHCQLKPLNLSLERVPSLSHLGLAGNNLESVPVDLLRPLQRLSFLDLSSNHITSVEANSFAALNLSRLDLSHNLLGLSKSVFFHPEAFADTSLTFLDISFNHLNNFDSSVLGYVQEDLRELALSGNYLRSIRSQFTHTLPSLRRLHLAYNAFDNLPVLFPPDYYHLELLNVSGNQLRSLADNLPYLLPNLKELDLSANLLSSLSQINVDYMNDLEKVWLHNNPWDCTCSVHFLQRHMRQRYALRYLLAYSDTRCASPPLLKGQPLLVVQGVSDCAVLFGASYGLSQSSELFVLLTAIFTAAVILALLSLCVYCTRERQYKGSYVTRECSRTPLTMTHATLTMPSSGTCSPSSTASDPLAPPPAPPPPHISFFGI